MLGNSFGKKRDQQQQQQKKDDKPSRVRLTWLNTIPTIKDVRILFAEAEKNRGVVCELPIRTNLGAFLLACQNDHLSTEPSWTLYAGEDGSKQVWNYMNGNLEMITDIIGMSVIAKDSKTEVKIGLDPQTAPQTPAPAPEPYMAPQTAPQAAPSPQPALTDPNQPYDPFGGWQAPAPGSQPAWGAPGQEQTGWNAGAEAQPGWGQQPSQTAGWGQAPADPMAGWNQPDPNAGWAAQQPAPADSPWKEAAPATPPAPTLESFAAVLAARCEVSLAELSMDPVVPPQCVDTVLKLQEMILTGHFNEHVAVEALRISLDNGGVLDDNVIAKAKSKGSVSLKDLNEQAVTLLQHAGLVTAADMSKANAALAKHKTAADALVAAKVIDELILEAARDGQAMVLNGQLREDQVIIALHYCARSRAKFQDALSDLSIDVI